MSTPTPVVAKFEARQLEQLSSSKKIPTFSTGDTVKVNVRIKEGDRTRIQAYEGVCIARAGNGINESFTVRKISYGEGVERVFPLFSPVIDSIELVRRGSVRRAKLYYMRDRRGKSARITERTTGHGLSDDEGMMEEVTQNAEGQTEATATPKKEKKAAKK
ncbi:MAG TPA: 50S ribosomal protein L19 [Alphaproteobacteria bacterium]